jgi:hypothetical protein
MRADRTTGSSPVTDATPALSDQSSHRPPDAAGAPLAGAR